MTPQDLINLPGAGNAEKALRKMGKWQLTTEEKIVKHLNNVLAYHSHANDHVIGVINELEGYNQCS